MKYSNRLKPVVSKEIAKFKEYAHEWCNLHISNIAKTDGYGDGVRVAEDYFERFIKRLINKIWDKVVDDIVFMAISDFSGSDPSDNLMEREKQLYFRLIEERIGKVAVPPIAKAKGIPAK